MRVLCTGGAGFIGSHLVDRLIADGHEVTVLDDFSTGHRDNLNPDARSEFCEVEDDVRVSALIHKTDIVFHLAAAVGVRLIAEDPVRTLTTNIEGTKNVLGYCSVHGKRVVIASSSEVYGQREVPTLLHEDERRVYGPTTERRWAYAESKAIDELLALAYADEHGLDVRIARLFNTVGPRQSSAYGMVLPRFAEQAVAGVPLTIFGDGEQTRSFCHVLDAVEGLRLLAFTRPGYTIYNIGNPHNHVSINDLAEKVRVAAGSVAEAEHVSSYEIYGTRIADMRHRRPDIGRAYADLGWMPQVPLNAIIEEAVLVARGVQHRREKDLSEA